MFENYFSQIGSNILSSPYSGLISVSAKSSNLITTFAFDKNMENPRATAVFTEKNCILGVSNDDYETAASYTYKPDNESSHFKPTVSFLQKSDDPPSIKVHMPYTINFHDFLSLKIFASDEITLNSVRNDEIIDQANNNQNTHLISLSGKATHRLFNGKVTAEETLKFLPQFFFSSIVNYSNIVLDAYLSKPIQQIKCQYAHDNMLCFTKLSHVNNLAKPFMYNFGFIVTDPKTMIGFYFTQVNVLNCPADEEKILDIKDNEYQQQDPENLSEYADINSFDIMDVFKIKLIHKQDNYKIATKLTFDNSYQVIPKAGIEIKLNQNKILFAANGKKKEIYANYIFPFGKNNICSLNASIDWTMQNSNKFGVSLQLNH